MVQSNILVSSVTSTHKSCIHDGKRHNVNSYGAIEGQKFDYVLMMDVLEHIEDDAGFLKDIRKYQKAGTVLFITVPAFQFLFSLHDKELHHYRRYDYAGLRSVLEQAGYRVPRKGGGLDVFLLQPDIAAADNEKQNTESGNVE